MELYARKLEERINYLLDNKRAMFILGARQVGKTTLLHKIRANHDSDKSIYFDLEDSDHLRGLSGTTSKVTDYIISNAPKSKERILVLIDEVQYLQDFSHNIKYLVDHYSDRFKLVLTGSSSLLIKKSFSESLVGRKDVLELFPLSFCEYCLFKGENNIAGVLDKNEANYIKMLYPLQPKLNRLLSDYMQYGGYPSVVLSDNANEKIYILKEIVSSYILKDIRYLFSIENIDQFNHLMRYLAVTTCKELNISSISIETGMHRNTIQRHILALVESYIIRKLSPFNSNLTTELKKIPKVYFVDPGIRNTLLNNFNGLEIRTDKGEIFENYVFNQLYEKRSITAELKYWKTRNGQEVDFVVIDQGNIKAYEVRFGREAKNFLTFKSAYPKAKCRTIRFDYNNKPGDIPGWAV